MKRYLPIFTLTLIACCISSTTWAQSNVNETLQRFASPNVEAVAHVDLKQIDLPAMAKKFADFKVYDDERQAELNNGAEELQKVIQKYRDAGVESIFVFVGMSDPGYGGPTVVLKTESAQAAKRLEKRIQTSIDRNDKDDLFAELRPSQLGIGVVAAEDHFVVAAAAQPQLDVALTKLETPRQIGKSANKVLSQSFGLLVLGTKDSRKAIRQIGFELPAPFEKINGTLVADKIDWAGLSLSLSDNFSLQLILYSDDSADEVREVLQSTLKNIPAEKLNQWTGFPKMKNVVDALDVSENNGMVRVSTDKIFSDPVAFRTMIGPMEALRTRARETQMMNNLRQIMLAMHNHESANKQFPAKYSTDNNGKPLLSWRVKILPFLDQMELYEQFRLDEPWDSEHNKKLIPLMPQVYADVMPGRTENNRAGKTIIQVPVGPGTAFESIDAVSFRDITDGSSNTIMLVPVAQDKAVYWTQPADWEVDPQNSTQGMVDGKRERIPVALGDGSVQMLPAKVDGETLFKFLTIAGGEVVEWPR